MNPWKKVKGIKTHTGFQAPTVLHETHICYSVDFVPISVWVQVLWIQVQVGFYKPVPYPCATLRGKGEVEVEVEGAHLCHLSCTFAHAVLLMPSLVHPHPCCLSRVPSPASCHLAHAISHSCSCSLTAPLHAPSCSHHLLPTLNHAIPLLPHAVSPVPFCYCYLATAISCMLSPVLSLSPPHTISCRHPCTVSPTLCHSHCLTAPSLTQSLALMVLCWWKTHSTCSSMYGTMLYTLHLKEYRLRIWENIRSCKRNIYKV